LFLFGCASEWRAEQPITPTTYRLPAYRSEQSVGNLRRLAVLPVRVRRVGTFSIVKQEERWEAGIAHDAARYLTREKGYQAVPVVDENGGWHPELVVKSEYESIDILKENWEAARSEEDVAATVSKIGRALDVDGIISMWMEEYDTGSTAGGALWGMANIFLLNAPLFYGMMHTNAEAVIYQTYSGQPVWRSRLSGDSQRKIQPSVTRAFFANLENAIPARLVK
jgi:hypothetical protein